MKILFEGQSLLPPRTGIGRVTAYLLRHLDHQHEIEAIHTFLSVFPWGQYWNSSLRSLQGMDFSNKIAFHRLPIPQGHILTIWNRYSFPPVEWILPKADLVVGPAHVLPSRATTPGILTLFDTSLIEHPEWYSKSAAGYRKQIINGIHFADGLIVPSNIVKEKLIHLFGRKEKGIDVIPCPFEGEYQVINRSMKHTIRLERFGNTDPYICWIGEINPRKNVPLLFSLLKRLLSNPNKKVKLVLIGGFGFQGEEIVTSAQQYNLQIAQWQKDHPPKEYDILLTGYVNDKDKKEILSASDILVFPSLDEGFGYPILEAMASGVPVVCSKAGSIPEIAGDSALIVDEVSDLDEYVQRCEELLSSNQMYEMYRNKGLIHQKKISEQSI